MKIQFLQMGQGVAQKRSVTFLKVTHQFPAEIKELKQPLSASSVVSLFQTLTSRLGTVPLTMAV